MSFMDNHVESLIIDSSTTAKELCSDIYEKLGLKDTFGFSILIAIKDKVRESNDGSIRNYAIFIVID